MLLRSLSLAFCPVLVLESSTAKENFESKLIGFSQTFSTDLLEQELGPRRRTRFKKDRLNRGLGF